jgi:hypothetical protein
MNEWNIQSRAHACGACNRPFVDKQPFHTLLFDEKAGLRRMDVCQACWAHENTASLREHKGFLSYWHGVYEAPTPHVEVIRKDTAESLLRKLLESNDPRYGPAAYILAVMLERKRLLKVKEQFTREGRRCIVYEQPKTGDLFAITDPDLKLDQLAQIQHDVAHLLEHGLDPTAVPAAPVAAAEPVADRLADSPAENAAEDGVAAPAEAAPEPEPEREPATAPAPEPAAN